MTFEEHNKKKSPFNLNILHQHILRVGRALRDKYRYFDIETLFEACCKELPNPEPEIDRAIRELFEMREIIPGEQLLKEDILTNERRRKIYEYILKYPGAHKREIRKIFNLGAYVAFRHLGFLEKFGFIRKKNYLNKLVFFPIESDEAQDLEILILRNETTRKIYESVMQSGQIQLIQLQESLQIPSSTIHPHLQKLVEGGLLKKIQEGSVIYYVPLDFSKKEDVIQVKREFDYVGGNIRFKVAVRNLSEMAVHNISITLNPAEQFFIENAQQNIANLASNTTRGIDFILTPLTCGRSKIFGAVSFEDAFSNVHSIPISPKEINIKCPLVTPQTATQAEVNAWIKNLKKGTGRVQFDNISKAEAYRLGHEQVSALDLTEVQVDNDEYWSLFSGQVKVTGQNMAVKLSIDNSMIVVDVWASDLNQTTGFLAYISNLINIALETSYRMVRKTEDVTQKIVDLMKSCTFLDTLFILCDSEGLVSEISSHLSGLQQLLSEAGCDLSFIQPITEFNSTLSSFQPDSLINPKTALNLRYKILDWLKQIHGLIQYQMNTYKETFDGMTQISENFSSGLTVITEKIRDYNRIYGLNILVYLLILDKSSGITLFEKELGDLKINPDLIGGFLHALQSFGTEISSSETSMKTLTYENYQFQIETGNFTRIALILHGNPNEYIELRLKEFVTQFEQNFEDDIQHFTGNLGAFRPANALFRAIFK